MGAKSLTGLEKAAVLLKSLPAAVVDKVLQRLDVKHAASLSAELEKLKQDGQANEKLSKVIEEARNYLDTRKKGDGAEKNRPAPSAQAAPAEQVDIRVDGKPEEKPPPAPPKIDENAEPLKALAATPPQLLAAALEGENVRTVSLLIHCLDIEAAGQVYKRLSPAQRKEVSMRFAEQPKANEEMVKRIAQAVLRKCQSLRDSGASTGDDASGRDKRVAALLRGLDRNERTEMLTLIGQSDAELVNRVKTMLYQFEDIGRMENASVQKLLADVDTKSLVLAMSGAAPEIESKILANLSKRAQAALKEEADLAGKITSAKSRQGRQMVVEAIQRLDERGDLAFVES